MIFATMIFFSQKLWILSGQGVFQFCFFYYVIRKFPIYLAATLLYVLVFDRYNLYHVILEGEIILFGSCETGRSGVFLCVTPYIFLDGKNTVIYGFWLSLSWYFLHNLTILFLDYWKGYLLLIVEVDQLQLVFLVSFFQFLPTNSDSVFHEFSVLLLLLLLFSQGILVFKSTRDYPRTANDRRN